MSKKQEMGQWLTAIVAHKRLEVARQKQAVSLQTLLAMGRERMERPTYSMRKALAESPNGIIAEFKRRSPSKGWIFPGALAGETLLAYERAGAAACSVLTDGDFFGGSLSDLQSARAKVRIPLLRKDFIIDEYQVFQARVMGADAVLLIAAALTEKACASLAATAHALQMEVLLEIHSEAELSFLTQDVDLLGVNNRDLNTFHTDVATSFRLAESLQALVQALPSPPLPVAESGVGSGEVVSSLRRAGFRGFLIGETFMKTPDPGESLARFIKGIPV
jgi:indole-3-glycerol phosphate synthase